MVEHASAQLNVAFHALANETRRALLERLGDGPATISELSQPFDMTFFAVSKHLRVLESAGLVARRVAGREHHFELQPAGVEAAADWLTQHVRFWNRKLDVLERVLRERRQPRGGES